MASTSQRSFSSGELAPALYARTDVSKYASGLRTCRNMLVMRQGGVCNRAGTELVGKIPDGTLARILPFEFNAAQTYVLEFTNQLLRFIRAGAYVGAPYTVTTPYLSAELADIQTAQSADVVTTVHQNHAPADLARLADTNWTLTNITFAAEIAPPTGLTQSNTTMPGPLYFFRWVVTAVSETGQESIASTPVSAFTDVNNFLTWTGSTGAFSYNIYKAVDNGAFGLVGISTTNQFTDKAFTPDLVSRPPIPRNPFPGAGDYPGAVGYYQGRRIFGATNNHPETIYTSRSADYNNFTVSSPSQDDDALTFTLAGAQVNQIKHFVDSASFLAFTTGGEWIIGGDQQQILRPSDINAMQFSDHGVAALSPIKIDRRVLYVQARGSIVRDVQKDPWYGYKGVDLTLFSTHLFDGHALVDWAYQELPYSIVWVVRDDGVLLGLTNIDEQQILGWHRHDTDGKVENVCVIPEGNEDRVYLVVNRGGSRYVERMASRFFTDVQDAIFMDCTLTYDGRNTNSGRSITLSGGTDWTYDEQLTVTYSGDGGFTFSPSDVGNQVFVTVAGTQIRVTINAYSSPTVVTGFPNKTVPAGMRGVAVTTWARAVDVVAGLSHLEGKAVSVFADGFVVASPNNSQLDVLTVTAGVLTLNKPYAYIHVGLPYVSDIETLDIDTAEGPGLKGKKVLVNNITAMVDQSRGIFAGQEAPADEGLSNLVEYKVRQTENYDEPVHLRTGVIDINILAEWESAGRVFIRQVDPLPLTVLSLVPSGFIPSPT